MKRHAFLLAGAMLLAASPLAAQEGAPLKTAVDGTFAPHAMPKLGGGYEGFNIDLAKEIGKRLKRKVTIDAVQFSGIVPALHAGTYDFVAAPTTVTKERADNMLFTEGYLNTDFQFLIKKGAPEGRKARRPQGQDGVGEQGLGLRLLGARPRGEDRLEGGILRHADRCRAGGACRPRRCQRRRQYRDRLGGEEQSAARIVLSALDRPRLGRAAAQGFGASCGKSIENAIECMKLDGTIAAMHERWFGVKPAAGSAAVTVFPGYGVPGMAGYDPTEHKPQCN